MASSWGSGDLFSKFTGKGIRLKDYNNVCDVMALCQHYYLECDVVRYTNVRITCKVIFKQCAHGKWVMSRITC